MVEEYNLDTGVLSKRAWKTNSTIYKTVKWEVEVGDPFSEKVDENIDQIGIKESQNSVSTFLLIYLEMLSEILHRYYVFLSFVAIRCTSSH